MPLNPNVKINSILQSEALASMSDLNKILIDIGLRFSSASELDKLTLASIEEANRLLEIANNATIDELHEYIKNNPVNALTTAFLVIAAKEKGAAEFRTSQARKRASAPHKREDKVSVRAKWDVWKKDPFLYKNKTQFCDEMISIFGISTNTARRWLAEFQEEDELAAFKNKATYFQDNNQ